MEINHDLELHKEGHYGMQLPKSSGSTDMNEDIQAILVSEEQIQTRVKELADALVLAYAGRVPTMVCVLKGSVMFYTDLLRHMQIPLALDFMSVSSYGSGTTGGAIHIRQQLTTDIAGCDVIIVEDIIDSGRTLNLLKPLLLAQGARSVGIVTLLDKPSRRDPNVTLQPDYVGFVIEDEFVVGYGLDFNERYRNLPYIGVLKSRVYAGL